MAQIHVYTIEPYFVGPNHSKVMELTFFIRFEDDDDQILTHRPAIEGYIKRHRNYKPEQAYLVLHPTHTFTMNYKG